MQGQTGPGLRSMPDMVSRIRSHSAGELDSIVEKTGFDEPGLGVELDFGWRDSWLLQAVDPSSVEAMT